MSLIYTSRNGRTGKKLTAHRRRGDIVLPLTEEPTNMTSNLTARLSVRFFNKIILSLFSNQWLKVGDLETKT